MPASTPRPSRPARHAVALAGLALVVLCASTSDARGGACPAEMALVEAGPSSILPASLGSARGVAVRVCVDRWEASLVTAAGAPHSPYMTPGSATLRARSKPGVVPQAYISKVDAEAACHAAGKRLCREAEWVRACEGRAPTTFPYGDEEREGYCNDHGKAPLSTFYPDLDAAYHSLSAMNDPRLNQLPATVAPTGSHGHCRNSYGLYDMVGNLHEWVDDPAGTFRGGYFLDTHRNGAGCKYRTTAHHVRYHDYSTGFRCCKDPR